MTTSVSITLKPTPYTGEIKQLLWQLLESREPVQVATEKLAKALHVHAWKLGERLSRRRLGCGAFKIYIE